MGLFSSEKQTFVSTAVTRAIADDALPNSIRTGVINGLFQDGDIPSYILEELLGSIALKAERMYEYGRSRYVYGLPSGTVRSASQGIEEVQVVLDAIAHETVLVEYSRFGALNLGHLGWIRLIENCGYDPASHELPLMSAEKGKTVYLQKLTVVLPPSIHATMDPAALEEWGLPDTSQFFPDRPLEVNDLFRMLNTAHVTVDPAASVAHLKVDMVWDSGFKSPNSSLEGALFETDEITFSFDSFVIPLDGYESGADFVHAKYRTSDQVTHYWLYETGIGLYPTLDALMDAPLDISGTFFPFLYFRFEQQSMANLKGSEAYTSSRKLAKYLGFDYASVIDAIHENPDINDVEQAMLVMAVPALSTDQIELRYLFDFFNEQHGLQNPTSFTAGAEHLFTRMFGNSRPTESRNSTIIRDARFKMTLGNAGIYKKLVVGKIGAVGTYQSLLERIGEEFEYFDVEQNLTITDTRLVDVHFYRRQISTSVYTEIEVRDLRMTYYVWNDYTTVADDDDRILLIPLDRSITRTYPLPVREILYSRSLHYVFNSRVTVTVKWYQQTLFQFLITVVAIVISIFYAPGGTVLWSAIASGTLTVSALLYTIAIMALQYLITQVVVKFFVKLVGPEAAFIVAVLAAVAGYVVDTSMVAGAPWAEHLLQASSSLFSGVSGILQDALLEIQEEYTAFGLYTDQQNALLEDAQDLLKVNSLLQPFVLLGENPTDFFNRTVHSGNIGAVGISAISNYVDVALTLPKLSDTLGET